MISVKRANEIAEKLQAEGQLTTFIPADCIEQHKKDVEAITGMAVIYTKSEEDGIDVFKIELQK
jgi:hypothetical protein